MTRVTSWKATWLVLALVIAGQPMATSARSPLRTISTSWAVEGHDQDVNSAVNMVPLTYLIPPPPGHARRGDGRMTRRGTVVPIRTSVETGPRHGTFTRLDADPEIYRYQARDSYYGVDHVTLRVQVGPYRYRIQLKLCSVNNKDLYGCESL